MNMRIFAKGSDSWVIQVAIVRNGNQYRRQETIKGSRRGAERRYLEVIHELEDEAEQARPNRSLTFFSEAIEFYKVRSCVNPRSETYLEALKEHLGKARIVEMKEPFEAFLYGLKSRLNRRKKPYSNGSINAYLAYAKAALNMCVQHEKIERNPLHCLKPLKAEARDKSLSVEERTKLLAALSEDAPYLLPLVRYCLQVPCRRGEMVTARRADFNVFSNAIRIRNGMTKNDAGVWKPIPPDMLDYFKAIPSECPWLFYRTRTDDAGKVHYLPLGDFSKDWRAATVKAGIKEFRFHDTRHIAATDLINAGNTERQVMAIAGWKTNMLSTYYHRDGLTAVRTLVFKAAHEDKPDRGAVSRAL